MAFKKWLNGAIQQAVEVVVGNQISVGTFDHHQPTEASDAEMCDWLNDCAREYGNTDFIGPPPPGHNDPARFNPNGAVVLSRKVGENGEVGWAVVSMV